MPHENTPLITTVRVGPPRRRRSHNVLRRFCTIALSSTLLSFAFVFLVTVVFGPDTLHRHHGHTDQPWSWPGCNGRRLSYEKLKEILLDTPSSEKAEEWNRYYTHGAHLAGQNYSQAVWTKERWQEWGIQSDIVAYDVLLNRPLDHSLTLLKKSKSDTSSWNVAFKASLKEDVLKEDPTTGVDNSIPTFHGYSASGNVTGSLVYVNYGTYQDFEDLVQANVDLKGKIAIARYGGIFRGLKVKRAQEKGMIGVILYSDPGDDGDVTDEKGVAQYPNGPARNPSSVQRGSCQFLSVAPGDPTTPGYPSKPGVPRGPTDKYIPSIPSIPISYADALPLLKALNGHGPKSKDFNEYWNRNLGLGYKGVDYSIGPTPDDVVVNLFNQQDYITTPIWNVIGIINGTIPDEVIVVGNHRDAWIVGGAVDPNSGSAVLNEVIRSFGKALEQGWKPLRTIVFGSWDGEEYGLVGSTEWVEEYLPWLDHANVAYINIDSGASGKHFGARAAPLVNNIILDVTSQVQSPNQTIKGQTVRDVWDGKISTMGSGSDFTAFQDHVGIASLDVGFGGGPNEPVYHYHSNYDSYHWMKEYGDPGYVYHRTMAQILGLITAKLADEPVVSFSALDYAEALRVYVDKVKEKLRSTLHPDRLSADSIQALTEDDVVEIRGSTRRDSPDATPAGNVDEFRASLVRLYEAVWQFTKEATALDTKSDELREQIRRELPWWKWPAKLKLGWEIRKVNQKYKRIERSFVYEGGLDGREWFKHVVFAPGLWTGYSGAVFPGLMESIDNQDYANALKWVEIIQHCLSKATKNIK